ncbi:hypothetical protein R3P38DRAFT_3380376 [Favolaschia claudopus]|uniref:Uncharacterized protein n=1 Tax=Favolaschia claudopus TaxID=2862362 RepID=A0AAV9Z2F5_9AGAR
MRAYRESGESTNGEMDFRSTGSVRCVCCLLFPALPRPLASIPARKRQNGTQEGGEPAEKGNFGVTSPYSALESRRWAVVLIGGVFWADCGCGDGMPTSSSLPLLSALSPPRPLSALRSDATPTRSWYQRPTNATVFQSPPSWTSVGRYVFAGEWDLKDVDGGWWLGVGVASIRLILRRSEPGLSFLLVLIHDIPTMLLSKILGSLHVFKFASRTCGPQDRVGQTEPFPTKTEERHRGISSIFVHHFRGICQAP